MAFFNELGKKFTQAGQEVTQQAKIFAETTKINSHISDEEKQINNLFIQIGKNYFEMNKNNASDVYADIMVSITDAQARIEQYKEQIRKIKGISNCPNCGAEVANGSMFCNSCGAKMTVAEVQPTAKCPQCGSDVMQGSKFCDSCGYDVSNAVQSVDNTIPVPVNSTIPTPVNNAVVSEPAEDKPTGDNLQNWLEKK